MARPSDASAARWAVCTTRTSDMARLREQGQVPGLAGLRSQAPRALLGGRNEGELPELPVQ
jgi:hypothetical protein